MRRILFLCDNNAIRGPMAEGFALARQEQDLQIVSAGDKRSPLNPLAIQVMREAGIDISSHKPVTLGDLDRLDFDVVISLCSEADKACPLLPGNPERVRWDLPDPLAGVPDSPESRLSAFRALRDTIRSLVSDFFERGYLTSLVEAKKFADLILNSVSDGVIAHDLQRRIFYFNEAAEAITGYPRSAVINRTCDQAFPNGFCGGKCEFCDGATPNLSPHKREMTVTSRDGEERIVEMSLHPMRDSNNDVIGMVGSFRDLTRERDLARRQARVNQFAGIIGRDRKMLEVFDLIRQLADTDMPVMIQGESGTGKELVAAAIHNEGRRLNRLFVPVNCGAIPESLLESELFGHVKGAFTGAIRDKKGRFELANGGTIFLDEIGDISPAMQVKLLRVLQDGTFERVGGEQTMRVDTRIISATNKNILEETQEGRFREDLYYRLSVVPLFLPPLRDRRNDIPLIAEHLLKTILQDMGRTDITISPEAMDVLVSQPWQGNVRELQNWIQFALVKCRSGAILPAHLPLAMKTQQPQRRRKLDIEAARIALRETDGNKVEAARLLGISRATLYRLMGDAETAG